MAAKISGIGAYGLDHLGDAADLMRIVAAGDDVVDAGEIDGELDRLRIEVDGVVVELLEVRAGRPRDVGAALAEGFEAAVEPFGKIRDRAAEMARAPSVMRGKRSGMPLKTSLAAASVVSIRKPTSGISQKSVIASTPTGCVG